MAEDPWNRELREHIPKAFSSAWSRFQQQPENDNGKTSKIDVIVAYMSYVPFEGQCPGFLEQLPKKIHDELRRIPCLLGTDEQWAVPSSLVLAQDEDYLHFLQLDPEVLKEMSLEVLHPQLAARLSIAQLCSLGVHVINSDLLLKLHTAYLAGGMRKGFEWFAFWFYAVARLYKDTASDMGKERIRASLVRHKLFPLQTEKFVALGEDIYFPDEYYLAAKEGTVANTQQDQPWLSDDIRSSLRILHSSILLPLDKNQRSFVISILQDLFS